MNDLAISIVIYKHRFKDIESTLQSVFNFQRPYRIYIIDNSPTNNIYQELQQYSVEYIFTNKNIGFAAGHNIAIRRSIEEGVKYHLVLNPDISFDETVLNALLQKMDENSEIGLIMPKILNIDGSVQFLPKLLPTPFNLLIRIFNPLRKIFYKKNNEYTLENYFEREINVPIISGCFSLFRVEAFEKVGLYDETFFMYFEDFDLSRRIHSECKTVYYPSVSIIHGYDRGATKSFKLFKSFIKSAIIYFNKWGWFNDKERKAINSATLENIK